MVVIVLGPPGAGKGTQSKLLAERTGLTHISTGDLLREAVANATELGRLAQPYMDRGELVPDTIMIGLAREKLEPAAGAILDGFPRTLDQARALDDVLHQLGRAVDRVIYLAVPIDVLIDRLTSRWTCGSCQTPYRLTRAELIETCPNCGGKLIQRSDDTEPVVRRRLEVYNELTAPLIAYYRSAGLLAEVHGDQSVEEVLRDELAVLNGRSDRQPTVS